MTEYQTLSVEVSTSNRVDVAGVIVTTRPDVDAVLNAIAADGWRLDRFTVAGSFAWLVLVRQLAR